MRLPGRGWGGAAMNQKRAPLSGVPPASLSGRRDLNPGPQHPDCCALAWLRYAPHDRYYT